MAGLVFRHAVATGAWLLVGAAPGGAQLTCDPLPQPAPGTTVSVSSVVALADAVSNATSGQTILVANGTYDLQGVGTLQFTEPGVTLRSASGNRDLVVIDGGFEDGSGYLTNELVAISASDVTIADVTLQRASDHPIHVYATASDISGILLHNLRVVDPGQQAIKVNPAGAYIDDSTIECCSIELTDAGRPYVDSSSYPCYTGGIDVHQARGWVVSRNYFEGFWCDAGFSEHAIHFWKGCRDTVVEGNVIVDCARGIGFGLSTGDVGRVYDDYSYPSGVTYLEHIDGIVRNNFVAASDAGLFASEYGFDNGISLELARGAQVVHNTVASTVEPFSSIEWRYEDTQISLSNNLVSYILRDRGGTAVLTTNIEYAPTAWFENVASGDLHLTDAAATAVDAGTPLAAGLADADIDGETRDASPDVGADEVTAAIFADDFESGDTSRWS